MTGMGALSADFRFYRRGPLGMVIARASDEWLLATQPSPCRLLVAKVGFGGAP